MNRESNKHTYIFATIMVVSVASVLSFTSESLKDLQNANIKKEKMQNILSSVGINVSRDEFCHRLFSLYSFSKYSQISSYKKSFYKSKELKLRHAFLT